MAESRVKVYGTQWCGDCKRAKKFLGEQKIDYEWIDVERDAEAMRFVESVNNGLQVVPTIVFEDGSILAEPSNAQLAEKLRLQAEAKCRFHDLVIVGGGPAGLTAAIYAAREGMDTVVIESGTPGGQVFVTERLDNYPGFPEGVGGAEFSERLVQQAQRYDVEIVTGMEVSAVGAEGRYRFVRDSSGGECRAHAILIATGSRYRRLGVPGEEDLIGRGVHYCATCDGPFYKGKELLVVGEEATAPPRRGSSSPGSPPG